MKNRLRVLRAEHAWSQAEVAKRLGVSRQTVNAVENGKYDPSLPLAFGIARLFGLTIEEVFDPDGERVSGPGRARRLSRSPGPCRLTGVPRASSGTAGRAQVSVEMEEPEDPRQVAASLAERRHAAVARDGPFAGVVGRQGHGEIALEVVEQPGEIGGAGPQVRRRLVDALRRDAEAARRWPA